MPILDPLQQYYLYQNQKDNNREICPYSCFLHHFLCIASDRLAQNLVSIQDYFNFERIFLNKITIINKLFDLEIPDKSQLEQAQIDNFFEYLDKYVNNYLNKEINDGKLIIKPFFDIEGIYFTLHSKEKVKERYFRIKTRQHSWFFTDTSIAILCINKCHRYDDLVELDIVLLKSLGLTLVLICKINCHLEFLKYFIEKKYFAEIHIKNGRHVQRYINNLLSINSKDIYRKYIYPFYGYFYLYIYNNTDKKFKKKYKSNPYCTEIFFSNRTNDCLSSEIKFPCKPFAFCSTGSKTNYIRIVLCNVPLFDQKNLEDCLSPSNLSDIRCCFVKQEDFLVYKGTRVEVLFEDNTTKYVDFTDIHLMKPELFVTNMLHLMKNSFKSKEDLQLIKQKAAKKIVDNKNLFKYEKIHKFLRNKKTVVKDTIAYLSYAVAILKSDYASNKEFRLRDNQIFTIYQSCFSCLFNGIQTQKGIVYQIDTGEGKSIIIQLIAALLAINNDKNYVHIASSNIYLSERDYSQSYDLYQKLQISSSVLLHENELYDDKFYKDKEINKSHFKNGYFEKQSFENSLNMNYCSFGIDNDYNEIQCPKILFSNFINFEAIYLKLIDNWEISRVEEYFKNRFLIVDEADSILIDDLTNGTIISRPIKSNAKELLTFVYQCKLGKLSESNIQIISDYFDLNIGKSAFDNKFNESYANINLNQKKELETYDDPTSFQIENAKKIMFLLHKSNDQLSDDFIKKFIIAMWPDRNQKSFIKQMIKYYKKLPKKLLTLSSITINDNYFNFMVFICQTKTGCINSAKLIDIIKKKWPDTVDITIDHLNSMYKEIEIVHSPEFVDGKKYSIQPIRKKSQLKETKIINGLSKLFFNGLNKDIPRGNNDAKEEEETLEIVPFDYDNKGILEWNKEFSGFIQQFIAIKEMINNEKYKGKIRVKDIALNYSFVSHPILAKLYKSICGFTGTIGNFYDRQILKEHYQIETFKIPRNSAKKLIILPTILCKNYGERNNKIIEEVLSFHLLKKPVLVILQDLIEIDTIRQLFEYEGITNINIFTNNKGKDDPEDIVGMSGEISLGTNFCGRGADIKFKSEPLHIIVSYYTTNKRVLNQAFGRTARNGNIGTCRIICVIDEYLQPVRELNNRTINFTTSNFALKQKYQTEFINYYLSNSKIIFDLNINAPKITNDKVFQLKSDLNVNRVIAYNYKYPAVMTVDTFLTIQTQKIFSIYNCPNCKYSWILFQRYIKEMILESWAIEIRELDRYYFDSLSSYENKLKQIVSTLQNKINVYIPTKNNNNIFNIFENIYNKVKNQWQEKFLALYRTINENYLYKKTTNVGHFMCINFGFIPYTLVDESGSKINSFDNSANEFIFDPEISYYRNKIKGIRASITEKIDKLFNEICKKINEKIGCFTGLRLFLRRTLFGCEFGMCLDFCLENKYDLGPNCLFDKDPLLIFTLHLKCSDKGPILAGILIIVLVYISKICSFVFGGIVSFIKEVPGKKLLNTALFEILKFLSENGASNIIDKIFNFLNEKFRKILENQINKIREYDRTSKVANILSFVSHLINHDDFDLFNSALGNFKIKKPVLDNLKGIFARLFKVGVNVFLCLVAFFMNFRFNFKIKQYNEGKEAKEFDSKQNVNDSYFRNYSKITSVNDI